MMKTWKIFKQPPIIKKLSNGIEVHYILENTNVTYVQLDVGFGSYYLTYERNGKFIQTIPGIAHFLEHKMFAMEEGDAFKYLSSIGVSANAMTTYRQTSYTLNGTSRVLEAIRYLLKVISTPYFTTENIESEKKIIIEEISMYDNDPDTKIYQDLYKNMLHQHPLLYDILGTKESVQSIQKNHLTKIYRDFYQPKKIKLYILGQVDVDYYHEALEETVKSLDVFEDVSIKIPKIHEPQSIKVDVDTKVYPISRPKLVVGVKHQTDSMEEKVLVKTEIATLFLFQMMVGNTSSFAEKLIQDEIINDQFNSSITMEDETLIFTMDNFTDDTMKLEDMIKEYYKHPEAFIHSEAFDLLKRAYLGSYMMALDDVENRLFLYGKYYMNGISLEDAIDCLNELTIEDIWNLHRNIKLDQFSFLHAIPNYE